MNELILIAGGYAVICCAFLVQDFIHNRRVREAQELIHAVAGDVGFLYGDVKSIREAVEKLLRDRPAENDKERQILYSRVTKLEEGIEDCVDLCGSSAVKMSQAIYNLSDVAEKNQAWRESVNSWRLNLRNDMMVFDAFRLEATPLLEALRAEGIGCTPEAPAKKARAKRPAKKKRLVGLRKKTPRSRKRGGSK